MTSILTSYFLTFLHPFQTQSMLRREREKDQHQQGRLQLVGDTSHLEREDLGLTFVEAMSVSWIFSCMRAIYTLLAINMGVHLYTIFNQDSPLTLFANDIHIQAQKISIFILLLEVVFFPLGVWLYAKFWQLVLRFFMELFNVEGDQERLAEEVVNNALVSHFFLIVPIFGELASQISMLFYLFAGLRRNMGLNVTQSIAVLLAPLLLMLLMFFMLGLSFLMLFASF